MSVQTMAVKHTAKTVLKGKWMKSLGVSSVFTFSCLILIYLMDLAGSYFGDRVGIGLGVLCVLFLLMPLGLGVRLFFWRMIFGAEDSIATAFYWFSHKKRYQKAIGFCLFWSARLLLWGVLCFLPFLVTKILQDGTVFRWLHIPLPIWTANLSFLSWIFFVIGFAMWIFATVRYYAAPVLFVAESDSSPKEILLQARQVSRDSLPEFIALFFSCFWWILSCILFVPLFFLLPYFSVLLCVHTRFSVFAFNKSLQQPDIPPAVYGV